jgi:hypothetical protein
VLATASINRDPDNLKAEQAVELAQRHTDLNPRGSPLRQAKQLIQTGTLAERNV